MILLRAVLLTFIFIYPVKANTIYNLIKIPNLEFYKINTQNKLKYFYATSSFRLGVQKNIVCLNPNKKDLDTKYNTIYKNLNKYSYNFLKKINLKYIVLCENLSISGINTAGIPDNIIKTLILDIKFNKDYFERVIHHEVFHVINDQHKELFNDLLTTRLINFSWSLDASEGTTPPYFSWTSCDTTIFDNIFLSFRIDADVSSQDVSIPSITKIKIYIVNLLNKGKYYLFFLLLLAFLSLLLELLSSTISLV